MASYITKMYDMLDRIVYDYYGDTVDGIVEFVLEQNPGIERYGLVLPHGLKINLPARPASTSNGMPVIKQIRLWE